MSDSLVRWCIEVYCGTAAADVRIDCWQREMNEIGNEMPNEDNIPIQSFLVEWAAVHIIEPIGLVVCLLVC